MLLCNINNFILNYCSWLIQSFNLIFYLLLLFQHTLNERQLVLDVDQPGPSGVGKEMYRHQKVDRQEGIRSGRHRFLCDVCNKSFHYKYLLKLHVSVHSEERPYVCDKSFRLLVFLKEHQHIHSGEQPYSCDVCGKSFKWGVIWRCINSYILETFHIPVLNVTNLSGG